MRSDTAPVCRDVLGVPVHYILPSPVAEMVEEWRRRGERRYIVLTNPHSILLCGRDPAMRAATAGAALVLPDGVGSIWAARILGYPHQGRITGPNLVLELCRAGICRGWRHFFYGGREGVAAAMAARLKRRFPGLGVAGCWSPPFRALTAVEESEELERIRDARPDIVWVGLGAPKQEKWMARHAGRVPAAAMVGVGAAFDFHAGTVPWAPAVLRRAGLEWAWRLAHEPARLWRRNLDSPLFVAKVLVQRLRRRQIARGPGIAV